MRAAKRADYRRALAERRYSLALESFHAPALSSDKLAFGTPISLICGPNGAGKTRLVRCLAKILGCANVGPQVNGGVVSLQYRYQDARFTLDDATTGLANAGHGQAAFLSPAQYALAILDHLQGTANLQELLEPYSAETLSAKDVAILSFLINKPYDAIEVFEIDDPGGAPRTPVPMPYFTVTSQGVRYGSETMGLGELSLFCLWWNLTLLEKGSVLIIDEPEAFASPHSQYALAEEFVRCAVQRELTFVIVTQSQPLLDSLGTDDTQLLVPRTGGLSIIRRPARSTLLNTLGVFVPKQGVLLVEDRLARLVTTTGLGLAAPELLQVVEVFELAGTGPLEQALGVARFGENWFHMVGVFDGDQRTRDVGSFVWPVTFLPGSLSPEADLRRVLSGADVAVAAALGRSIDGYRMALAKAAGADLHDWLGLLADGLSMPYDQLVGTLVRFWFDTEKQQFLDFAAAVRSHIAA